MRTSRFGELDRVGDQVDQDLPEMDDVAAESEGQVGIDPQPDRQPLRIRLRNEDGAGGRQLQMEIEFGLLARDLPGLYLGEVEQVVDQPEQRAARCGDRPHHVLLLRLQGHGPEQIGHADDPVERRSDLVAHVGQEAALGAACLLGLALGLGQLADQGRHIGGQQDEPGEQSRGEVEIAVPERRGGHHHRKAGDAGQRRNKQEAVAVAETVAERDPEIGGVPHGDQLAAGDQDEREAPKVGLHGQEPARRGHAREQQDVDEKGPGYAHAGAHTQEGREQARRRRFDRYGRRVDIEQNGQHEDHAHHDLLVLAVGSVAEARRDLGYAFDPRDQRRNERQSDHPSEHRIAKRGLGQPEVVCGEDPGET
jgi:hypothetical protein